MTVDDALRELRCATAAQIRLRSQTSLEDCYTRLVELEAEGKAYLRTQFKQGMRRQPVWHWSGK